MRWIFIASFFLLALPVKTQSLPSQDTGRWSLGISVAHFLDPIVPGPMLFMEYRRNTQLAWRVEAGAIFNFGLDDNLLITDMSGVRLRVGKRWYLSQLSDRRSQSFRGVDISWRYLDVEIAGDFSRMDGVFFQRIKYRMYQHSLDISVPYGRSSPIGKNFRIDFSLGFGGRINLRRFSPVPEDTRFITNGYVAWQHQKLPESTATLITPVHLSLKYVFPNKR